MLSSSRLCIVFTYGLNYKCSELWATPALDLLGTPAFSIQDFAKVQQGHCGQWNTNKGRLSCCHSSVLLALQRRLLDWSRGFQPWEVRDCNTQMHHTRTPLATLYSLCRRFSKSQKSSIHPGAFIPFGSGPRNCIGMRLAHMEAKMTLIEVLSKFKICKAPETKVIEKILLILINDYVPGSAIQLYYSTVTIITLNTPIIAGSTGVGTRSCNGL